MKLTASDLAKAISRLPKDKVYYYIKESTRDQIEIIEVLLPEGPIYIKRYDPAKGETSANTRPETISVNMLWRLANAIIAEHPVQVDRVFSGSYNTRSALESLLAYTPQDQVRKLL